MHNSYCTLFNVNYLSRGLVLYESLLKFHPAMKLFILCMDETSHQVLSRLNLPSIVLIQLQDFETPVFRKLRAERTVAEYCWTCTPALIKYCIETFQLDQCTYVDADLMFFSPDDLVEKEFADNSVCLTPHYYTPEYDQSEKSGIYCVQYMNFKDDNEGSTALDWWKERCIEWCFNRFEAGKFGDQKYLDDWPERFKAVKVINHRGAGVAPWNVQQYEFSPSTFPRFTTKGKSWDLIFYHFHGLKILNKDYVDLGYYKLTSEKIRLIYTPYLRALYLAEKLLKDRGITLDPHGASQDSSFKILKKRIGRAFLRNSNIFEISSLVEP